MFLAKALVGTLLIADYHYRATVLDALESRWIRRDLKELEVAYEKRVASVDRSP